MKKGQIPSKPIHLMWSDIRNDEYDVLNEKQRAVINGYDGTKTYEEAAAALNLKLGTFKSRLSRARVKVMALRGETAE